MDKVPEYVKVLKSIIDLIQGVTLDVAKEVYLKMVRLALLYEVLFQFRLDDILLVVKEIMVKLRTIQGRCLRVVAGVYKATLTEALEAETYVELLDIYVSKVAL